jgi:hypothetical protein
MIKQLLGRLNLLEQTNPKFHQFELVKDIKERIVCGEVSKLIDLQLFSLVQDVSVLSSDSKETDLDATFYKAVAALTTTLEFVNVEKELLQNVRTSVQQLIDNLKAVNNQGDATPWDWLKEYTKVNLTSQSGENNQKNSNEKNNKKEEEEDLDRLSQFSFNTLPPYEKLPSICQDMKLSNDENIRTGACNSLSEFSPGDLLHSECWQTFRESMTEALNDPILHGFYIRLLWRLYRDAAPVQTGELYICLLEHLTNVARQGHLNYDAAGNHLEAQQKEQQEDWSWLRQIRLLNYLQRSMTKNMVYFPEKLYACVVVGTFNLLQWPATNSKKKFSNNNDDRGSVIGFGGMLSYCDPEAMWFRSWFASARPRDQMLNYAWQSGLLCHLIQQTRQERTKTNLNERIDVEDLQRKINGNILLHTLSMLSILVQYKEAHRALQCVDVPQSSTGVSSAAILPTITTIETCPLSSTNNLIRAIVSGALWLNVEKEHCTAGGEDDVTLGWWQTFRQQLSMGSALDEIYEYCSYLTSLLSTLTKDRTSSLNVLNVLNDQSEIICCVLSSVITTSAIGSVINSINNSSITWPFKLQDNVGALMIQKLTGVLHKYKESTTKGWTSLSDIVAAFMGCAVSEPAGLIALLRGDQKTGGPSLMLTEELQCIKHLLTALLVQPNCSSDGGDSEGAGETLKEEYWFTIESILASQLKLFVIPLLRCSLACQSLEQYDIYSLILRAASVKKWRTTPLVLEKSLHECVIHMSLTANGLQHLIMICDTMNNGEDNFHANAIKNHFEQWTCMLAKKSEQVYGGDLGSGVHEAKNLEIISNVLLSKVLSKVIYSGTMFCWKGVKTLINGDGDAKQDDQYLGDPTTLHHVHPEDMPTWIKELLITSKLFLSGPHAGMLLCDAYDNDSKTSSTKELRMIENENLLLPRGIIENLVMMNQVKKTKNDDVK